MSLKMLVQILSVVAVLVLSGCTAQNAGKVASTSSAPLIAPPAGVDESTCGLEGFVGDESFAPIAGADVGIQGTDQETKTALDGRFTFSFLDPGSLTVVVSALAFETENRKVPCEAGSKITDLVFSLKEIPKSGEQYIKIVPLVGRIGCAVGIFAVGQPDKCGKESGLPAPVDNQAKTRFDFQLDPGEITGAAYEMQWVRTGTFGAEYLMLDASSVRLNVPDPGDPKPTYCPTTSPIGSKIDNYGVVVGKSVLCFTVVSTIEGGPIAPPILSTKGSGIATILVDAAKAASLDEKSLTGDKSSKLVLQQNFEVYASFFYHGMPIPDDYRIIEA